MDSVRTFTAFLGNAFLETGPVEPVVRALKEAFDAGDGTPALVFEDATGKQVDFDLEGTPAQVIERLAWHPHLRDPDEIYPRGRGRPRLGVVSREISLFPRHWEWLEKQPQGASAAIRRLIEDARAREPDRERDARAREAAGSFMWAMAGNLPDFEEASRALYAKDNEKLAALTQAWPKDVRDYLNRLLPKAAS
jgi:hypothetical protein